MNQKKLIIIGATALVLIIAIFYVLSGRDDGSDSLFPDLSSPFGGPSRSGEGGFLSESEIQKMVISGNPAGEYEAYRAYARYPHESRPLTKKMKDLLEPWKVGPVRLPIITNPDLATENSFKALMERMEKEGKSPEEIESALKDQLRRTPGYLFDANRHTLTYGDELIVSLTVTDPSDDRVAVEILEATIQGDRGFNPGSLGSIDFNDRGVGADSAADDKTYTASWKLPSTEKKYWGNLDIVVKAKVPGVNDPVTLHHHFYSSPISPATFSDQFSERLENGSLVIDQIIDVKMECRFQIQANLFSVELGEPTHWVTVNKILPPGRQTISYLFFGKIFRDGGYEGKFRIQDIRGTCENLPFPARWLGDPSKMDQIMNAEPTREPLMYYMPFTQATFVTQSYPLASFSEKEWDSEEKTRTLEELKKQKEMQ